MLKRKLIISCGLVLLSTSFALAQKAKVKEANRAYSQAADQIILASTQGAATAYNSEKITEPLLKAKAAIDEATTNPETAENADAWVAKGMIYSDLARVPKFNDQNYYNESIKAFEKALALNPKSIKKQDVETSIFNIGLFAFNGAISAVNSGKYDDVVQSMTTAKNALTFNNNSLFKDRKEKDTIVADAEYYIGYGYYSKKDYPNTIKATEAALQNPINQKNLDAYRILAFAYGETKNYSKQIAIIEAAKAKFPTNKDLEIDELNYYISQGKETELVGKFEEAVKKNPDNPLYLNNLAILYRNLGSEKDGKFPEDAESWQNKADAKFNEAIKLDPQNHVFQYNLGNLLVTKADLLGNKMNKLGTSKLDNQKYDQFSAMRINYLKQAVTYFEKAASLLEPKFDSKKIGNDEQEYLFETWKTLSRLYGATNNPTKAKEIKDKMAKNNVN
ncbi:MAG TPA: hypothetical protein PKX92_01880 [Edaphocola sp.]|nr:hypothetical protein [Edaphocola sp.]